MKPETLEALLIDRALGELSPEAAELLDAWCGQHPAAAATAAAITATLQQAREASASEVPAVAEPLPAPAWRRTGWRLRRPELLRLAACLALGASLGWLVRPAPQTVAAPAVALLPSALVRVAEPAAPRSRIWSISARVEAARQSAQPDEHPKSTRSLNRPSFLKMSQPEPQS